MWSRYNLDLQYERHYSWLVGWRPPVMIGAKYNSHSGLASAMICSGTWESNVADRMQKFKLTHGWRWSSEWEQAPSESKDGWTYAAKSNGDYLPVCRPIAMFLSMTSLFPHRPSRAQQISAAGCGSEKQSAVTNRATVRDAPPSPRCPRPCPMSLSSLRPECSHYPCCVVVSLTMMNEMKKLMNFR